MLLGKAQVGIATHDKALILGAEKLLEAMDIPKDQYEFQMLLGVEEKLRNAIVEKGHPMRVYVPYGQDWYAYCIRRMKENPNVAGQVTKALIKNPMSLFKN